MREHKLRAMLKAGEATVGSWVSVAHPTIAEVMAQAGFDWLAIDMEHGIIGIESVLTLVQAINTTSVAPLVRVPWNEPVIIKQVLETAPAGLILPQVNTAEEAEAGVRASKYPVDGIRGIGCQRGAGFGAWFDDYLHAANDQLVVIVQIEHVRAVENLRKIVSVKGVDAVFVGANDLSASMGLLGQPKHPDVQKAIQEVLSAARHAGIAAGLVASDPEDVNKRLAEGFQVVAIGHDVGLLSSICRDICAKVKKKAQSSAR
jgi:2-keto-3-deoxy-L-rhamnonate aldolase RhmA